MALRAEVTQGVLRALKTRSVVRQGLVVPGKSDLKFLNGGGAVAIDATYAYADLAGSSELAQSFNPVITANIIRAYVNAAARMFKGYGGEIRSFDGDRVMAIFIGDDKNPRAARAALALNWAVDQVINPSLKEMWPDLYLKWQMAHVVGIASGEALIVRGGVLGDNDMISVGGPPNIAAKLSDIRAPAMGQQYSIYITEQVYQDLPEEVRLSSSPPQHTLSFIYDFGMPQIGPYEMWNPLGQREIGGAVIYIRGSTYYWEP